MELQELKVFVDQQDNFEIRVISHADSRFYQVEIEDVEGRSHVLSQRGKPKLFRTLDDVYLELKHAGINRAYLIQYVDRDATVGREAHYQDVLGSRMPLVF